MCLQFAAIYIFKKKTHFVTLGVFKFEFLGLKYIDEGHKGNYTPKCPYDESIFGLARLIVHLQLVKVSKHQQKDRLWPRGIISYSIDSIFIC